MARHHKIMRTFYVLLIVLLMFLSVPTVPTAFADGTEGTCLNIAGSASIDKTAVAKGEDFTVTYRLTPEGSLPSAEERLPADISLVLDVSGSMNYPVDSDDPTSQKRIDALKQASQALLNKLREVNLNDRVGLIKFSTTATKVNDLTTNYGAVQTAINALSPGGGTNIDHGLTLADAMLSASQAKNRYVILLTDGAANYYTDTRGKTHSDIRKAREEALDDAQVLAGKGIVAYTIALAEPGGSDVDIDLLKNIATVTKGQMYEASNAQELAEVFESIAGSIGEGKKLSSIVLRQPLPTGFVLADGNNAGVTIDNGQLVIAVNDIPYPFDASSQRTLTAKLKQVEAAGEYRFADASVTYTNACGETDKQSFPVPGVTVTVQVRDMYGNTYIGDGNGKITRKRTGDNAGQWEINTENSAVTNIAFKDADTGDQIPDDTIVVVSYLNGHQTEWNLTPTKPVIEVKDKNGAPVTDGNWYQGPGSVTASGSTHRLPSSIIYLNDDFREKYISGYEYRISGGDWMPLAGSGPIPDGDQSGVEVRAVTHSVSGEPDYPHYGETASQNVSFDSTPPSIGIRYNIPKPSDDAAITLTATDSLSPVTGFKVWLDDSGTVSIQADASKIKQDGDKYSFTFKLSDVYSDPQRRVGWHKIVFEAASEGGATRSEPDYFMVNPGPAGELKPDAYEPGTTSDKPVTVIVDNLGHPVTDRTFGDVRKSGLTIKQIYYAIKTENQAPSDTEWKALNGTQFRITTSSGTTAGTYYVFLKIVDSDNVAVVSKEPVEIKLDFNQNRY